LIMKEEKLRREVKASKKRWRMIRQERFAFLDADVPSGSGGGASLNSEEKKIEAH